MNIALDDDEINDANASIEANAKDVNTGANSISTCIYITCNVTINEIENIMAMYNHDSDLKIIFDSGATSHILPVNDGMTEYTKINGTVGLAGNSHSLNIVGKGNTNLIDRVLHVPGCIFGLISEAQLDNAECTILRQYGTCTVWNNDAVVIMTGTQHGNLYYLDQPYVDIMMGVTTVEAAFSISDSTAAENLIYNDATICNEIVCTMRRNKIPNKTVASTLGYNALELLHHQWGHADPNNIKTAFRLNQVKVKNITYDVIKDMNIRFCPICQYGKMTALPRKGVSPTTYNNLEYIGVDWKPITPPSQGRHQGYFLFSDRKSNWLRPYLSHSKSTILWCLNDYKQTMVDFHKATWKILQSDSAQELMSANVNAWTAKNHITSQFSAPHRQDQNGMVERDIGFLSNTTRTAMAHYRSPLQYWGYAVEYSCDLINHTHVSKSNNMTPYQCLYGQPPDVSHFVPFYAPGVYHLTKAERRNKPWAYKAAPCRMLGLAKGIKNGYLVLNVKDGSIKTRTDCIFDESLYEVVRTTQLDPSKTDLYEIFETFRSIDDVGVRTEDTEVAAAANIVNELDINPLPHNQY